MLYAGQSSSFLNNTFKAVLYKMQLKGRSSDSTQRAMQPITEIMM